jgi:hypothetical protein
MASPFFPTSFNPFKRRLDPSQDSYRSITIFFALHLADFGRQRAPLLLYMPARHAQMGAKAQPAPLQLNHRRDAHDAAIIKVLDRAAKSRDECNAQTELDQNARKGEGRG